jgi:hypothetical protein
MTAWTPSDLGASLLGWFDVHDAPTVIITGSGVSQWVNKAAGSTFTLTQGTDSLRPGYVTDIIGFSSTQNLVAGSPPVAYDFIFAGRPLANSDWRSLFLSSDGGTTENTVLLENATGRIGAYQSDFRPAGSLTWPDNTDGFCYAQVSSAGPITISRDGGTLASTGIGHASVPIQGWGGAGSYGAHTYGQAWGWVYEIVFVPYNASDDTRQKLEGYVAWKWGLQGLLPSGHPYKAAAPTTGATAYTLTAAKGVFALTGTATALTWKHAYSMPAANGAVTLAGIAAGLVVAVKRAIAAATGSLLLTGQATALRYPRGLTVAAAALVTTGIAARLVRAAGLAANAGQVRLSAAAANLVYVAVRRYALNVAPGAVALSGSDVWLDRSEPQPGELRYGTRAYAPRRGWG